MTLLYKIAKPTDFVFDYLVDMQKFVSVHPLIHQIDSTGINTYLVHEMLKIGFYTFSFKYQVTIVKNVAKNLVRMQACILKMVNVNMEFTLKTDQEFTIVEEHIIFKSILPIQFILKQIFRKQHTILFKNIEKDLSK